MNHQHPELGAVDIYPVGVLRDLLIAYRALTIPGYPKGRRIPRARRSLTSVASTLARHVDNRDWHGLRQSLNGYLAEPTTFPAHMRRCGHAWTKRRALADLTRHYRATLEETR